MPGLLLLLLVAQLLDGAHCAEHHLGCQLCVVRGVGFAADICVGLPIQARVRIGVGVRIGHVIVVQIATAAALMRHVARVLVVAKESAYRSTTDEGATAELQRGFDILAS